MEPSSRIAGILASPGAWSPGATPYLKVRPLRPPISLLSRRIGAGAPFTSVFLLESLCRASYLFGALVRRRCQADLHRPLLLPLSVISAESEFTPEA